MRGAQNEQLEENARRTQRLHDRVGLINDPAVELVLTRRCANLCKVTHMLRAGGDVVEDNHLRGFDTHLRGSLGRILAGLLDDRPWARATAGVKDGGLGFRQATAVALPAFVASRTAARPLFASLGQVVATAGLLSMSALLAAYDTRTAAPLAQRPAGES